MTRREKRISKTLLALSCPNESAIFFILSNYKSFYSFQTRRQDFFTSPDLPDLMNSVHEASLSKNKNLPSQHFFDLVEEWAGNYIKNTELAAKIMKLADSEGLSDKQVREALETALRNRNLSERRILQLIPAELKNQSKARTEPRKSAAQSAAKPEPDPEDYSHPQGWEPLDEETDPEIAELAQKYGSVAVETATIPEGTVPVITPPTITREEINMNTISFKMSARDGKGYMRNQLITLADKIDRELPALANRGWHWCDVDVTIKVLPK